MSRRKYLIILLICVLALAMVFGFFYYGKNKKSQDNSSAVPANENRPDLDTKKTEGIRNEKPKTEIKKDDTYYYDLAASSQDHLACQEIKKERAKNLCLENVAFLKGDAGICNLMTLGGEKIFCLDLILLKKAEANSDTAACASATSEMLQQTCILRVVDKDYGRADCDVFAEAKLRSVCWSEKYSLMALAEKKVEACYKINNVIIRINCLSTLTNTLPSSDADKDGLTFSQEILNGTDPNKADTDTDGFLDDVEVATGNNPAGPGKKRVFVFANCDEIQDGAMKMACIAEFPDKIYNYYGCGVIKDWKLKAYCDEQTRAQAAEWTKTNK